MVMRYPIEKWNRGELEDKFHELAEQNVSIKKHNNELERKLKILNGQKVNGCQAGQFSKDGGLTQTELSKLRRENHVLSQKLKVLRTQLINYSRTTPSQAISQSTSQALLISNVFSKRVPSSINNAVREFDRSESTENNKVVIRKEKVSDEHMNQMLSINPLNSDNKTDMIKIYRRSQEMELELKETVFKFQKSEEKVVQLRREYDKVVCELELSHRNLQAVERRLAEYISSSESFVRHTADDSSLSEKGLEIAEKEIAILREENNVLKAANDKLINSSFDEEKAPSKTLVDEVNALKSHVETIQQNFVSQRELRKNAEFRLSLLQSELSKLEKKNHRLSDELRLCMQNARQQQWRTNDYCDLNNNNKFSEADRQSNFMVNKQTASVSSTVYKSPAYSKDVLDRLFDDVIGILNTHMRRGENDCLANESILMENDNQKPSFNERWQKMYEEIYSELEKVRIMLVTQYDINEKMKEEIVSLQNKADFIKRKCDTKLRDSAVLLEDREKRIQILENQLRSISQNDNRITEAFEPLTQLHSVDIAYNKCGLNGALNITELTMRFSKLVLTEAGLQLAKSMKPVLFLSVEFFDFELQTTPLLQGPEAIFDYSTVYEVMVSNLFIHYLDTDGVTLELFETHGLSYEQWSVERISLKKLLLLPSKASNHLAGQVKFTMKPASADGENKLKKPVTVALLDYTVDVPFSLISALNDQKKRMTASFYLTNNAEERSADMLCNHLYVNIHQCHGIKKLLKDPQKSCFFMAAYQLYDLPVHFSSTFFSDDGSPQFNDTRAWTFQMMNNSLHDYLKTQELLIYLLESESIDDNNKTFILGESRQEIGRPAFDGRDAALALVNIPLFPLIRNQHISGTFPLLSIDGIKTDATVEISIRWKMPYIYEDDDLQNIINQAESAVEKANSKMVNNNIEKTNYAAKVGRDDASENKRVSGSDECDVEQWNNSELKRRLLTFDIDRDIQKAKIGSVNIAETDDSNKSGEVIKSDKRVLSICANKPSTINIDNNDPPYRVLNEPPPVAAPRLGKLNASLQNAIAMLPRSQTSSTFSNEITAIRYFNPDVDDKVSINQGAGVVKTTLNDILGKDEDGESSDTKTILSSSPSRPSVSSAASDATYTAAEDQKGTEPTTELTSLAKLSPAVHEIVTPQSVTTYNGEAAKQTVGEMELERMLELESDGELSIATLSSTTSRSSASLRPLSSSVRSSASSSSLSRKKTASEELTPRISSLRDTRQAVTQIIKPPRAVEFTDPLHHSIPPSETSSFTETISDNNVSNMSRSDTFSGDAKSKRTKFTPNVDKVIVAPSSIRVNKSNAEDEEGGVLEGIEVEPRDAIARIRVLQLRLVDGSPLQSSKFDGAHVFVEWCFLDFNRDLCETFGSFKLPRTTSEVCNFNAERVYELDRRRIALLRQWMQTSNRISFTLVLDPGEDPSLEFDDLCIGELNLREALDKDDDNEKMAGSSSVHLVIMRDTTVDNNTPFAVLEVELSNSANLRKYL